MPCNINKKVHVGQKKPMTVDNDSSSWTEDVWINNFDPD